jgi:hypothetical protein
MTTYYVSSSGSDSNAGTSTGAPFATFSKAAAVASPNDTVLGKGGDTIADNAVFNGGITLGSYGTGQCTINGGAGNAIQIKLSTNTDVAVVSNLTIAGSNAAYVNGSSFHGLVISVLGTARLSGGVTITGLTVSGFHHGISITIGGAGAGANNVAIANNLVHDCQLHGILIEGNTTSAVSFSNTSVHDNTVHDITGSPGDVQAHGWGGYGIQVMSCLTDVGPCVVYNNLVYNTGANSPTSGPTSGQGTGIWCQACDSLVVRNNVVHHAYSQGGFQDGNAYDCDQYCTNCVFEYNVSHDCQGASSACFLDSGATGNVFRFNLGINDATVSAGSIRMSSGAGDGHGSCTWHNNTYISLAGRPCVMTDSATDFTNKLLYNNLFYCASGPIVVLPTNGAGTAYDHNCYVAPSFSATYNGTNQTTLAAWRTATGNDAASLYSATSPFVGPISSGSIPAIVPGSFSLDTPYWLTSGSPPQGAGGNLSSLYGINAGPTDLNGNAIGTSGYSIGAISPAYAALAARLGCGGAMLLGAF